MTITIDEKTYEADSEAEAMKIIRKCKREKARQETIDNAKCEQAKLKAKARACDLYDRLLQKLDCPRGWIAYTPDHPHGQGLCQRHPNPYTMILYLEDKQLPVEIWRQRITHVVCNGSGFVWGIFADDDTLHGLTRFYTIQQHEGIWCLHQCVGIHLDWFCKPKARD